MKECFTCKKVLAEKKFNSNIRKKDGLEYQCRKCQKDRYKRGYSTNADKIARRNKIRYWQDPEHKLEMNRRWYKNNKEKHRELVSRWFREHPEFSAKRQQRRNKRVLENGGSFTKEDRKNLFEMYDNQCLSCGATEGLVADHIIPVLEGGSNDISNRQPLCFSCNAKKHTKKIDYRP